MAYADIQEKVGQTLMANQTLLAQARKDRDDARKKKKDKINLRKQQDKIKAAEEKARKEDREYYKGLDPNAKVYNTDGQEVLDDGSIVVDEDIRTNGPIIDPNTLLQIGGAAAGFGGNILRMLINPLGGNAVAMNFEDTGLGDGGFISTDKPHIYINRGAEAYILMPDGDFRFDGMYDPKRHCNAFPGLGLVQRNDDMKIAKLPHTPPTEKIVLPNGKLMDSPLRFKTDQERIRFMEDFSRGYGRYS